MADCWRSRADFCQRQWAAQVYHISLTWQAWLTFFVKIGIINECFPAIFSHLVRVFRQMVKPPFSPIDSRLVNETRLALKPEYHLMCNRSHPRRT